MTRHLSDSSPLIPVWGGFECSIVRVGDTYRDELTETGHSERDADIEILAGLGVKALRHGVLWEQVSPEVPDRRLWQKSDERLGRLRSLGIRPIIGLLHHGSGPKYTNLLDPEFPQLLADYAGSVALRYPWVTDFTPVNEPGTTARFSCLYGHWFPHVRDTQVFLLALFLQVYGTALAMRAIRTVTPQARLIQTEELGRIFATPALSHQAAYENERRWLSLDLLCGRVGRAHPWRSAFLDAGVAESLLDNLVREPCPPDIIGINYYLTSDRFLDDRCDRYPLEPRGGNGRDIYVDRAAVRSKDVAGSSNLTDRILEVWRRYTLPVAVTEIHNGCSREEQMRWLADSYQAALRARALGADIRGFTVWAFAGSVDWNSLLTRRDGHYESGVLEGRGKSVRVTALAEIVRDLAATGRSCHHLLEAPGWWQREIRLQSGPDLDEAKIPGRPLLITGADGTLGQAFARLCRLRALPHKLFTRQDMDIALEGSVESAITRERPWAVINAAGYVRVSEAEREPERCHRENCIGAETLARACSRHAIPLVIFSSDLVFDGQLGRPYVETDRPNPTGVYGASKASAERLVLRHHPQSIIVRTSAFFGPWDRFNFVYAVLSTLKENRTFPVVGDSQVSPTYVPDLVNRTLDLLIDGESGVWHVTNDGSVSWGELGRSIAALAGFDPALVVSRPGPSTNTALRTSRGHILPPLKGALARYLRDQQVS